MSRIVAANPQADTETFLAGAVDGAIAALR
jgi:hypothetical protein